MYHFIVRRKLLRAFADINAGRYDRVIPQFAAKHRHIMYGEHALAGERNCIPTTTQWYARLQRLLPDLRFKIDSIAVTGWPWHTVAMVSWRDHFTLSGGGAGNNQGVHVFTLAWGRVTSLAVHCDTTRLRGYCERMAAAGVVEAAAAPIRDTDRSIADSC